MKLKKLTTLLIMWGIIAISGITSVSAAERLVDMTDITFTPTSVSFTYDNRPNLANLRIDCYYLYQNIHGMEFVNTDTISKNNAVLLEHEMFVDNTNYRSKFAQMIMYENGRNVGKMSKNYWRGRNIPFVIL